MKPINKEQVLLLNQWAMVMIEAVAQERYELLTGKSVCLHDKVYVQALLDDNAWMFEELGMNPLMYFSDEDIREFDKKVDEVVGAYHANGGRRMPKSSVLYQIGKKTKD